MWHRLEHARALLNTGMLPRIESVILNVEEVRASGIQVEEGNSFSDGLNSWTGYVGRVLQPAGITLLMIL